jgi:cellulose biosynthesis protein BcsQ
MTSKHLDEARIQATLAMHGILAADTSIERAVLIDDLFGRIRVVLWGAQEGAEDQIRLVSERMEEAAGPFWAKDVWHAAGASEVDRLVYERAWGEATPLGDRLRRADRVRNRTAWLGPIGNPPWQAMGERPGPPIVVFYSFKGGVGRTTALAAFAIQRARMGERVAVLDFDLDAPGIGTVLAADEQGTTAPWGVVDYLLECPVGGLELRDYYHACRRSAVTGDGEILVVPAGSLDPAREYVGKLARLDFDPPPNQQETAPLALLLTQVKEELNPQWVLVDARAGLSESAGVLLSGVAHLHALFGTSSEQSWLGLRLILERIGATRVRADLPQLECLLVQAMVPDDVETASAAKEAFAERALGEFRDHYYAPDPDDPDEDRLWYVRDSDSSDAPHVPAAVSYQRRLAHYRRVDDVADDLAKWPEYVELVERVAQRFARTEE